MGALTPHFGAYLRSHPPCLQAIMSMRQQGMVKGGTDACAIVGYGDRWYEPQRVRFMDDEPVRHKMLDLIVSVVRVNSA